MVRTVHILTLSRVHPLLKLRLRHEVNPLKLRKQIKIRRRKMVLIQLHLRYELLGSLDQMC